MRLMCGRRHGHGWSGPVAAEEGSPAREAKARPWPEGSAMCRAWRWGGLREAPCAGRLFRRGVLASACGAASVQLATCMVKRSDIGEFGAACESPCLPYLAPPRRHLDRAGPPSRSDSLSLTLSLPTRMWYVPPLVRGVAHKCRESGMLRGHRRHESQTTHHLICQTS